MIAISHEDKRRLDTVEHVARLCNVPCNRISANKLVLDVIKNKQGSLKLLSELTKRKVKVCMEVESNSVVNSLKKVT